MMRKEQPKKAQPPFRFLRHDEFAALTQEERIKYLQEAIKAVKRGDPLANVPDEPKN